MVRYSWNRFHGVKYMTRNRYHLEVYDNIYNNNINTTIRLSFYIVHWTFHEFENVLWYNHTTTTVREVMCQRALSIVMHLIYFVHYNTSSVQSINQSINQLDKMIPYMQIRMIHKSNSYLFYCFICLYNGNGDVLRQLCIMEMVMF